MPEKKLSHAFGYLQPDTLASEVEPNDSNKVFLETLPRVSVEPVAELPVVVHFAPAVTTPFAAGHVHNEVAVLLVVVVPGVVLTGAVTARRWRKAVDLALR